MANRKPKLRVTRELPENENRSEHEPEKIWTTHSTLPKQFTPAEEVPHLVKQARKGPIPAAAECQGEFSRLETGYHKQLYEIIAGAYAVAHELERNWEEWKAFINLGFWQGRKRTPRRDKHAHQALKWTMIYVFSEKTKHDRPWKYARAVQGYLEKGLPPEDVAAQIEKDGGVEAIVRQVAKERRLAKAGVLDSYYVTDCPDIDEEKPTAEGPDQGVVDIDDEDIADLDRELKSSSESDEDPDRFVTLRVTSARLRRLQRTLWRRGIRLVLSEAEGGTPVRMSGLRKRV